MAHRRLTCASPPQPPRVASHFAASGVHSDRHAIGAADLEPTRELAWVRAYDGYQSGWQLEPRVAGCGGPLTMFASGSTALGDSFSLSLSQTSALVGFLAGDYIPATVLPPCPNCTFIVANAYAVAG